MVNDCVCAHIFDRPVQKPETDGYTRDVGILGRHHILNGIADIRRPSATAAFDHFKDGCAGRFGIFLA